MKYSKTIIRRVLISAIREGEIKRFDAAGIPGEQFLDREFLQQYGFTSRPLSSAEGIVLGRGNVFYLIGSDDRRYRLAIADGEVALYTDEGDKIHLKRGQIDVVSGTKVAVTAPAVELGGGALKALIDERIKTIYDLHTHLYSPGPGSPVPTAVPAVPLNLALCSTTKTKAS